MEIQHFDLLIRNSQIAAISEDIPRIGNWEEALLVLRGRLFTTATPRLQANGWHLLHQGVERRNRPPLSRPPCRRMHR